MASNETLGGSVHPGGYVKQHVIPKGMTVTRAASLLGIGRPALSRFLNGKAALSQEMARRLEHTFGADCEHLLDLQSRYDRREEATRRPVITGMHAPTLISIRSTDIDRWADGINARHELPALLRRLIHSTGSGFTHVDFPAGDNAERPGWDGMVETTGPTPWIPEGKSGWEFGCNRDARAKAEHDYVARVKSVSPEQRRAMTFVFVTPRNWPGKREWATEKAALGEWRDVRAHDGSDLEQWLEQSAATQIWLAERFGWQVDGYRSLDQCWLSWAEACKPALSRALFDEAVKRVFSKFERWLHEPPERPLIVAADSRQEALSFLYCLVSKMRSDVDEPGAGALVFDTYEAIRRFDVSTTAPRIAAVHDPAVEREIGDLWHRSHCVIVRPSNDVNTEPDIQLGLLGWEDFSAGLKAMGLSEDRIERLDRESARSLTVLRRRLSELPAVRTPRWADDEQMARKLLPAALIGAWHNASPADREVVRLLADADDYSGTEADVAVLMAFPDVPVWSVGAYRGVISRIDALFGVAKFVTESDLNNFFFVAECVLSEADPALDLPEDQRWMAAVHGKVREHSAALRQGIRETLVLLAIFGNQLFRQRLGFDAEARVADFIRKLLLPFDREKLLSQNADLPDYAEAAPKEFLSLLEVDLRQPTPAVQGLMHPVISVFDSPLRTHLLWALEGLAWAPLLFPRVVELLAKLCTIGEAEVHDNWVNKPENTLASLFRSWLPQTGASLEERVQTFERLCQDYPTLGWAICIEHLDQGLGHATPNHRPCWRDYAVNAGRGTTEREHFLFIRKAADLALNWPCHDQTTLTDLVRQLEGLSDADQLRVWDLIERWADSTSSEDAKAHLRQRIHGCAHVRHLRKESIAHPERERGVLEKLTPTDLVTRCAWLFASYWVDLPPDDDDDNEEFDSKRDEHRLRELRLEALQEIWATLGFEGVATLLDRSDGTTGLVGHFMAEVLSEQCAAVQFAKSCLDAAGGDGATRWESCLAGFLANGAPDLIASVVGEIDPVSGRDTLLTLLLCLPYGAAAWHWLDDKPDAIRDGYWRRVEPRIWRNDHGEDEINRTIDELLAVHRAPVAFEAVHLEWDKVETSRLKKLLEALVATDSDDFPKGPNADYYVSNAFTALDKRPGVKVEEKAWLEFAYLRLLRRSEHGVPNLEKQLAMSPELYVQAIACLYKRSDGKEDPPEIRFDNSDQHESAAMNIHDLLRRVRCLPRDDHNAIDSEALRSWLERVRTLCRRYGRSDAGDVELGQLLVQSLPPGDSHDIWPSRPICEVLQWMASEQIGHGFEIGTLRSRGAHWRGEGGGQERELAERYRGWARKLVHEYPFVGALLERIAGYYDTEAGWQDTSSEVRRRLPYL